MTTLLIILRIISVCWQCVQNFRPERWRKAGLPRVHVCSVLDAKGQSWRSAGVGLPHVRFGWKRFHYHVRVPKNGQGLWPITSVHVQTAFITRRSPFVPKILFECAKHQTCWRPSRKPNMPHFVLISSGCLLFLSVCVAFIHGWGRSGRKCKWHDREDLPQHRQEPRRKALPSGVCRGRWERPDPHQHSWGSAANLGPTRQSAHSQKRHFPAVITFSDKL